MRCPSCDATLAVKRAAAVTEPAPDGTPRALWLLTLHCPNRTCPLGRAGTALAEERRERQP